jgi:hypothetical protein
MMMRLSSSFLRRVFVASKPAWPGGTAGSVMRARSWRVFCLPEPARFRKLITMLRREGAEVLRLGRPRPIPPEDR